MFKDLKKIEFFIGFKIILLICERIGLFLYLIFTLLLQKFTISNQSSQIAKVNFIYLTNNNPMLHISVLLIHLSQAYFDIYQESE